MGETLVSTKTPRLQIPFSKLHGAQNDFIAIDNRADRIHMTPEQRQRMCHRHLGIGADGMFEIHRSDTVDFKLMHFSSKGVMTSLCGNGTRCAIQFCRGLGLPFRKITVSENKDGSGHTIPDPDSEYHEVEREIYRYGFPHNYYVFEAFGGIYFGTISTSDDECFLRCCSIDLSGIKVYQNGDIFLDTGSPHHIKLVPSVEVLEDLDAEKTGRIIVNDMYKEVGSHVSFVSKNTTEGVSESTVLRARTYEFTVDYETKACGTGAIAMAVADVIRKLLLESGHAFKLNNDQSEKMSPLPLNGVLAELGKLQDSGDTSGGKTFHRCINFNGGVLQVHFQMDSEQVHSIWLQGPAEHVMDGVYWQ